MATKTKKREKGLSYKRQRFAQEYTKTLSPTEAALATHSCKSRKVASDVGYQLLNNPNVTREIERILDGHDITEDKIALKISEGLDATIISDYKGEAVVTEIPDQKIRHKFVETVVNIRGLNAPTKTESLNIDLKVEAMSIEELKKEVKHQLILLQQGQ